MLLSWNKHFIDCLYVLTWLDASHTQQISVCINLGHLYSVCSVSVEDTEYYEWHTCMVSFDFCVRAALCICGVAISLEYLSVNNLLTVVIVYKWLVILASNAEFKSK